LFSSGGEGGGNSQTPSDTIPASSRIKIDEWDVEKAVTYIVNHIIPPYGAGECASHVEDAIAEGGLPRMHCTDNGGPNKKATNLRYYGILEKNGFVQIYDSKIEPGGNTKASLQAGDVCIIGHKNHGKYHACMWVGDRWYSDHRQNNMISSKYPKSDSPYPVALYRYKNKKGTPKA
jgi:hypothetical protein